MNQSVGETLKYNHKPRVSGYYEFTNAVQTTQTPTTFLANNEQLMTFDISAGARSINFDSFQVEQTLVLAAIGDASGISYYFRANPYVNRAVLRSKVGRYALELTEVPAFASTIPYRKSKNFSDFSATEIFGDKQNDLIASGTRLMQQDDAYLGVNVGPICTFTQVIKLSEAFAGIFSKNKDIPLTTGFYLDIYLCPLTEVIYQIGSTTLYANNVASAAFNTTIATLTISNISCVFKQQADDQINVGLQEYLSGPNNKIIVPFDYIQCQTQTTTATSSHNISQPITTIIGDKLKTIYYMVGLPRDSTNTNFYAMRYSGTTIQQNVYISSITVKLSNRVIGIYNIQNGDHLQYDYGFPNFNDLQYIAIEGAGATVNRGLICINNHFFLPINIENLTSDEDEENSNTGLPIRTDTNLTVQVILGGTVPTLSLKHYLYMVGTKYLEITGKGIEIIP